MIELFLFMVVCNAARNQNSLSVFLEGKWTFSEPLKSSVVSTVEIKRIPGTDNFILKLPKAPKCFSTNYRLSVQNERINVTTLSNQLITQMNFMHVKNILMTNSIVISCSNRIEFSVIITKAVTPTICISFQNATQTNRTNIFGMKHLKSPPNETFFQKHFMVIMIGILSCLFLISLSMH